MKALAWIGLVLVTELTGVAQTNFTAISNLNQPQDNYSIGVGNNGEGSYSQAISFITGNSSGYLDTVSIAMTNPVVYGTLAPFQLALYSDSGGSPGTRLAALLGNSMPTNFDIYVYTNSPAINLATNTTYWIVASSPGSTLSSYSWEATPDNRNLDPGSVWTLGTVKGNSGGGWQTNSYPVYPLFSVAVAYPPAPTLTISQPIVLSYPASIFPYVLQQSTNLSSTNWVPATGVILGGTLSNQAVYIVPPAAQHLFYRLQIPY